MSETFCDVSVWQGAIDWGAYRAAGFTKASIKATEGVGFTDSQYPANEAGTRGLQRIHYAYARPDLSGPEAEADWFWSVIGPHFGPTDLAELDYEQSAGGDLEGWKNRFLARLATYTPRYGMYSAAWFMQPRGITWGPGFAHAAVYGPTAPTCDIWQYSSSGSFPGMNGLIDSNLLLNPAIFGDATPGGDSFMAALTDDEQREMLGLARKANETLGWVNGASDRAQKALEWGAPAGGAVPQGYGPTMWAAILTAVTKPMDVDALAAALAAHIPVDVLATAIAAHVPGADAQAVAQAVVTEFQKRLQA